MVDTLHVAEIGGYIFDPTGFKVVVNWILLPLAVGGIGYKLKDYLNKIETARLKNKAEDLEEKVSRLESNLNESQKTIGQLKTQVDVCQGENKEWEKRFGLREQEQVETVKTLKEESKKKIEELETEIGVLLRGENGTTRIVEWDNLFQMRFTSYVSHPVQFRKDWVKFFGISAPLISYPSKIDCVIKPQDERISFERIDTQNNDLVKWIKDNSITLAKEPKIRILDYPEQYQVIIKLFRDIDLHAKIQLISSQLPQPHDQHKIDLLFRPGEERVKITKGGRYAS